MSDSLEQKEDSEEQNEKFSKRKDYLAIYIARHGQTDENITKPRILQGHSQSPLNAMGNIQSAALAWRLKDLDFDEIYTSDLLRSKQTAKYSLNLHKEATYYVEPMLRERDIGPLAGLAWPVAKAILSERKMKLNEFLAEAGESQPTFDQRVFEFYTNTVYKHLSTANDETVNENDTLVPSVVSSPTSLENQTSHRGSLNAILSPVVLQGESSLKTSSPMVVKKNSLQEGAIQDIKLENLNISKVKTDIVTNDNESCLSTLQELPTPTSVATADSLNSFMRKQSKNNNNNTSDWKTFPRNILVFWHGGPIQTLTTHLIRDLKYDIECDYNGGYPKNAALYKVVLSKVWLKDKESDFEWQGRIELSNCASHLAGLSQLYKEMQIADKELRPRAPASIQVELKQQKATQKQSTGAQETSPYDEVYGSDESSIDDNMTEVKLEKKVFFSSLPQVANKHRVLDNGAIVGVDDEEMMEGQSIEQNRKGSKGDVSSPKKVQKNLILMYTEGKKGGSPLVHSHSAPRRLNLLQPDSTSISEEGRETPNSESSQDSTSRKVVANRREYIRSIVDISQASPAGQEPQFFSLEGSDTSSIHQGSETPEQDTPTSRTPPSSGSGKRPSKPKRSFSAFMHRFIQGQPSSVIEDPTSPTKGKHNMIHANSDTQAVVSDAEAAKNEAMMASQRQQGSSQKFRYIKSLLVSNFSSSPTQKKGSPRTAKRNSFKIFSGGSGQATAEKE